jgi:hypothetical protein
MPSAGDTARGLLIRGILCGTAVLVAVALPGTAQALTHREAVSYGKAYAHVKGVFGATAAGCKLIGPHASCHGGMTDDRIRASTDVLHRMFAPPPPPPAPVYRASSAPATTATLTTSTYHSASPGGGGYSDVPGVPSSFAACVAMRESTNGAGSSNIYGIQGGGGQGSLAEQKAAFSQMYSARGSQPWSPYDGC